MTNLKRLLVWVPALIVFFSAYPCFALTSDSQTETLRFDLGWKAYESGQYEQAFQIWHELANHGHTLAQINLGAMYDQGLGVKQDPLKAFELFQRAAVAGNPYAQVNLGNMYAEGKGVSRNIVQAKYWYGKAAKQDLASAQFHLGMLIATAAAENGKLPGGDRETAINWLYQSGLSYLKDDDLAGAFFAHQAILEFADDHPLEAQLKIKIQCKRQKPQSKTSDAALEGASFGTAWPISSGHVITNNHVVSDSDEIVLLDSSGQHIKAQIILKDEVNDIAVLEVGDVYKLPPALPLATSDLQLGAKVFTIGFPRVDVLGKTPKLTQGIISKLKGPKNDHASCQTTIPIQPGNSGGPMLNMRGEVVGVIRAMLGLKDQKTGETFILTDASLALKIEHIADLIPILSRKNAVIQTLPSREGNLKTLAKRVQDSLLIVVVR